MSNIRHQRSDTHSVWSCHQGQGLISYQDSPAMGYWRCSEGMSSERFGYSVEMWVTIQVCVVLLADVVRVRAQSFCCS